MRRDRKNKTIERFLKRVAIMMAVAVMPMLGHAFAAGDGGAQTAATEAAGKGAFDWEPLISAISHFESRGNARAVNGQYVGLLQISPVLVRECNNILRSRGSAERFTLRDRYSAEKSKAMFALIQSQHNPGNSLERAIRIWKGGLAYSVRGTQAYVNRVLSRMRR